MAKDKASRFYLGFFVGEDAFLLKFRSNFAETVTVEVAFEDPVDKGCLIRTDGKEQFA